jgi:plasmid stabilization system protein ParE
MAHRLAPEAETELDKIWYYVAKESTSFEIADRLIDSITDTFYLPASHPHIGRQRDADCAPVCAVSLSGSMSLFTVSMVTMC